MTDKTLLAIDVAGRIVRGEIVVELTREDLACAIVELSGKVDQLTFVLHCRRTHPDFEYATTQTARKSGDDATVGLDGEGWEPNEIVECHEYKDGAVVKEHWCNWERYEFHEDNYWRRRKTP